MSITKEDSETQLGDGETGDLFQGALDRQWDAYKSSVSDENLLLSGHALTYAINLIPAAFSQSGVIAREVIYEPGLITPPIKNEDHILITLASCKLKNKLSVLTLPDELCQEIDDTEDWINFETSLDVQPVPGAKATHKVKSGDLIGFVSLTKSDRRYKLQSPVAGKLLELRKGEIIRKARRQWIALILPST